MSVPVDLRAAAAKQARAEQKRGERRTQSYIRVQSQPRQKRKSRSVSWRWRPGPRCERLDQTDRPLNPFTPFKVSNPDAAKLYGAIVAQARLPVFYQALGVPDTLEGRFLVLSLNLFAVHRRLQAEGEGGRVLVQDLADRFTADMATVLREIGIGDLSVPKKVRGSPPPMPPCWKTWSARSRRAMRPSPPLSAARFPRTDARAGLQACGSRTM